MSGKQWLSELPTKGWRLCRNAQGSVAARWANPTARRGILAVVAVLLLAGVFSRGVVRVKETEVGVVVNNLTGTLTVEERAGYRLLLPWVFSFYQLDRSIQSLVMSDRSRMGFRGGDTVKIKTSDGSDVFMDLYVTYQIIPQYATKVLQNTGAEVSMGELWVRSAVRAMVAHEFGQLTTEQVYDAALRNQRAEKVVLGLNEQLRPHGLAVFTVDPVEFRFYPEYEDIIRRKKLADQEVEEQQSQARLAHEEKNKYVAEARYGAEQRLLTAQGEADRIRAEADGYLQRVRLEAETALVTSSQQAEGVQVRGLAEAEGMREAALAMAGSGGVNLVALEYAKQLAKIPFKGVPVLDEGHVGQYRLHPGVTAGGGR